MTDPAEQIRQDGELTYDYRDFTGQLYQLRADINPDTGECYLETYIVHEERGLQELHRSHPAPQNPYKLADAFTNRRARIKGANP